MLEQAQSRPKILRRKQVQERHRALSQHHLSKNLARILPKGNLPWSSCRWLAGV